MWIIYGVLLLSLEAVHCGWDYYGSIDTYFEPDFYISKMPMRNGVELYMQTKDFYRVLGVEVETAGKMKVDAEVNGSLIRIPNAPEYVCLNFRLEKDFFARRCIFLERLYGRIDMSFNLHIETLHNALQSYRIQWRASEDENFGILVYNTTHMKHLVQKTSFSELFYLRPGTTYVICVSSNVGRLQITCSTWKTNNWGLDTESMDSIKALPIPVQLEELGHTWAHIVWKPAKAYKRGLILAPEAYLLLAQQVGSNCPEQAIQVIQTAADEGVQETRSVVQAIKRAYFEPCMDINVIERHPPCSCSFKDRPVWIDGIPYRNIDRRNYSFELTINNLERNKVYNFTVIPLVPFFAVSTWLHMHVSVFGQTETKFHGNAVPSIFISVLCFFGVLGIIAYLAVGHYLHKKTVKEHKPDASHCGNNIYVGDYMEPRPAGVASEYEDEYTLPATCVQPAIHSSVQGRNASATLPRIPALLPEKGTSVLRTKNPANLLFFKRTSVENPAYMEPHKDNLDNNYEELNPNSG